MNALVAGPRPVRIQAAFGELGGFKIKNHEVGREKWEASEGIRGRNWEISHQNIICMYETLKIKKSSKRKKKK